MTVNTLDFSRASWRKSSHSGDNGGACVEVGFASGAVAVRDSKHEGGPVLVFDRREWDAFLARARARSFRARRPG
jgi:uncharacterized protein DUF397